MGIDCYKLKRGNAVVLERPVMMIPKVHGSLEDYARAKHLGAGAEVHVLRVKRKHGWPWYNVAATDPRVGKTEYGWVNSVALANQELRWADAK